MAKVIKIFGPKEKPYGWLSNNYIYLMQIDGQKWRTVTHYIFANILQTPMFRHEIRLTKKTKDIKDVFLKLYDEEVTNTIRRAVNEGINAKFKNPKLSEELVATGNAPIFYNSYSTFLGVGKDGKGANIYGIALMQARHILKMTFRDEKQKLIKLEKDNTIYEVYVAEKGLVDAIRNGNNLKEFLEKSPTEIIDRLGREKLEKKMPTRDVILKLAHKNKISKTIQDYIKHPEILVPCIRKNEMRKLRLQQINQKKEILFDMYADYLIKKNFPTIRVDQYAKAKEQQFATLGCQPKNNLENKLFVLFEKGYLSSRLSDAVDKRLASHYIVSEEDVVEAELSTHCNPPVQVADHSTMKSTGMQINPRAPQDHCDRQGLVYGCTLPFKLFNPIVKKTMYAPETEKPVYVFPGNSKDVPADMQKYLKFSPADHSSLFTIDERYIFPTISHYITTKLIALLPSFGGLHKAYPHIRDDPNTPVKDLSSFVNLDETNHRYQKLKDIDYANQLREYARKGMNVKFENRVLQDILIMTAKATLLWNDFSDGILGVGPRDVKGQNYVGNYLMELRDKYTKERVGETIHKLNVTHISTILDSDPFMKEWMRMRIKDMCKVLTTMKNYIWAKDNIDTKMNVNFVENVLDKIYQPCSAVFGAAGKITAKVPPHFRLEVQGCPGFSKAGDDVIEVMWKRIAVMIYYLIKHLKVSAIQNIRTVLGRIELMVSKGGKCVEIIPDKYDNCIVSALINLLRGITAFNKQFSYSTDITDIDVATAASIILNADVSQEIKPPVPERSKDENDWREFVRNLPTIQEKKKEDEYVYNLGNDIWKTKKEEWDEAFKDWDEENEEFKDGFVFPDDEDGKKEVDYGKDDGEDQFSRHHLLTFLLKEIDEIKDPEGIARAVEGAIETVKTFPMSKQVKRNRINFFATQR